jgi:hypothetical protein
MTRPNPEQPIGAHFDEALGQDGLEEAVDKPLRRQGAGTGLACRPILVPSAIARIYLHVCAIIVARAFLRVEEGLWVQR